jgi:hypothetical protein
MLLVACSDDATPRVLHDLAATLDLQAFDHALEADSTAPPDLSVHGLDLTQSQWEEINDAGESRSLSPSVTLTRVDAASATVASVGTGTATCTCNAQHAKFVLPKTFDCASATLEFDYTSSGSFGATSTSSLLFRFSDASGQSGYLSASEQSSSSRCALNLPLGQFPPAPVIAEGHNRLKLSDLIPSIDGVCQGTFDHLDVALEGYGCTPADSSSATLSNLLVY